MGAPRPPMEYLAQCSQMSLESMELARLNRAANKRKELQQVLNELIESEVDARLARAILELRRGQGVQESQLSLGPVVQPALEAETHAESRRQDGFEQLAIAFQADRPVLVRENPREESREGFCEGSAEAEGDAPRPRASAGRQSSGNCPVLLARLTSTGGSVEALVCRSRKESLASWNAQRATTEPAVHRVRLVANHTRGMEANPWRSLGKPLRRLMFANGAAVTGTFGRAVRGGT